MYNYLEQYDFALEFYSTALTSMKNNVDRAMCIHNIRTTLADQQRHEHALQSFQQSL
jgi:tetratricopeptide (TPR) repeat protein